ncbi:hypothetical protein [Hoeflea sp.]|uniref:hypothetical protein n=1 Tax=Hoeflea sp. TaxID=1940281 RepID=UPI001998E7D9|nr:hypothetical protein [Hoeflea sp.]MBC7282396.1 hypothetical protein [Hoeflea sp.]
MPKPLRPYVDGKAELEIQLGGGRREALRKHAAAVAAIQRQIGLASQNLEHATGTRSQRPARPLTAQQIALHDHQGQIDFDAEIRAHDHRYAGMGVDIDRAQELRGGFAGKLSDDDLERLSGYRIERAVFAGYFDAAKGTAEWRGLAQALCVSGYEALEREVERDEGDFNGKPAHPLLADASEFIEPEAGASFNEIVDEEARRRARGKNAKPLPDRTAKKYRDAAAEFASFRVRVSVIPLCVPRHALRPQYQIKASGQFSWACGQRRTEIQLQFLMLKRGVGLERYKADARFGGQIRIRVVVGVPDLIEPDHFVARDDRAKDLIDNTDRGITTKLLQRKPKEKCGIAPRSIFSISMPSRVTGQPPISPAPFATKGSTPLS